MRASSSPPVRERWLSVVQLFSVAFVLTGSTSVAKALTPNQAGTVVVYGNAYCMAPSSNSQGATIQQVGCTGASNQKFWFEPMGDGSYRIRHNDTGMCIDISGGSTGNGANAILWGCGSQNNQRWTADETVAHHIRLVARHSGKCLDVPNGTTSPGVNLVQYDCNRGFNQEYMFLNAGFFASAHGPITTLRAVHSGRCVTQHGAISDVGGYVDQWDCVGQNNQRFEYVEVANNTYVVRVLHSGLCIGTENGSNADGARILQYPCTGVPAQRWRNEYVGGGDEFKVVSLISGKVLDVYYAQTQNGATMQIWGWGGGQNQKFRVHRDAADRNFCSANDPASCVADVITTGPYSSYSDCRYGYNTGAGWSNYEYVYYDATDRCAWWHDKECWSRNNGTGCYEGMGGCSQDVNFISCVERVMPVTAEEQANRECVANSMLEDAADACEPFTSGRGGMYPLYNAEREGGYCDDVAYAP